MHTPLTLHLRVGPILLLRREEGFDDGANHHSQVAAAADDNIQTVCYYERRRLVPAPRRTASGYRQYPDSVVRRIRFIKRAQGLAFSLREIQELLALRVRPGSSADAVKRMNRLKIDCVERKVRQLHRIKQALEQLAAACARTAAGTQLLVS